MVTRSLDIDRIIPVFHISIFSCSGIKWMVFEMYDVHCEIPRNGIDKLLVDDKKVLRPVKNRETINVFL